MGLFEVVYFDLERLMPLLVLLEAGAEWVTCKAQQADRSRIEEVVVSKGTRNPSE